VTIALHSGGPARRAAFVAALLFASGSPWAATPAPPGLHTLGGSAAAEVRDAAADVDVPHGLHPLPLAASWATGMRPDGYDPGWQLGRIAAGDRLLPWLQLREPWLEPLPASYYEPATRSLAGQHLPFTLVATQLDALVALQLSGNKDAELSPLSPTAAWYEAGLQWARQPMLVRMQELYPDPPRVFFLSNNEQKRTGWRAMRGREGVPAGLDDTELRRFVGDAWVARYRELFRGLRDGLSAPAWRQNARFIGYDAFGFVDYFRWDGWTDYSLQLPGRFEPWPLAWDGASVTYYTHDWSATTDFQVFSPQVGASNLVPMLDLAQELRSGFWFELSVWDGQQPGYASSKELFYRSLGQVYDEARYGGFVQFGLWLTRPRVVREFRNPDQTRSAVGTYFDAIVAAVNRVHDDETLRTFWRDGRLLANTTASHPYQAGVPADWRDVPRWYLLDASANPPRPWTLETPLAVYALALERGTKPAREWLVYAHSPLAPAPVSTRVPLPGGPAVTVLSTRSGCFTLLREADSRPTQIGC
jgi:hypothetical protein